MNDLSGGFEDPVRDGAQAFRAILQAMARPGTIQTVRGADAPGLSVAAATVLMTLTDTTTPLRLSAPIDTADLRARIDFQTGAPMAEATGAQFALGRWNDLNPVSRFRIDEPAYPDRAARLIVEAGRRTACV